MDTLEKYDKYKSDKKLAKIIDKAKKSIEKRQLSLERAKLEKLQKIKVALSTKNDRKLTKYTNTKQRRLDNQIRLVKWKKPLKQKMPSVAKIKNKAHSEVQKYAKLSVCDAEWYVILVDTGERLKWNDKRVQAGHRYPKKNYPHLAFDLANIHPIKSWTNKRQGDQLWYEWEAQFVTKIGGKKFVILESLANNSSLKNQIRQHQYYQTMYETYKKLNDDLLSKLW